MQRCARLTPGRIGLTCNDYRQIAGGLPGTIAACIVGTAARSDWGVENKTAATFGTLLDGYCDLLLERLLAAYPLDMITPIGVNGISILIPFSCAKTPDVYLYVFVPRLENYTV